MEGDDIRIEPDKGDARGPPAKWLPIVEEDDKCAALLRDHPYLPRFQMSDVRATEYILSSKFKWTICDLNDETTCNEVCELLKPQAWDLDHLYNYSKEFIRWSLCPPGYLADWHVGVRQASSGDLVAFAAAIPTRIRVREAVIHMDDCCYLSVRPGTVPQEVVFGELLRRVNLRNVWQQVCRRESFLPVPAAVSHLWQRSVYLTDLKGLGYKTPKPRMSSKKISQSCSLSYFLGKMGIRKMEPSDVTAVNVLLGRYLRQFSLTPVYTDEEVNHWLLPWENMVDNFVIETSDNDPNVADFFSYTRLQHSPKQSQFVEVAHLFYYASSKTTLPTLMRDALLVSRYNLCNLFFATDIMNNRAFLDKLRFAQTGTKVLYYLTNCPIGFFESSEVGHVLQFAN